MLLDDFDDSSDGGGQDFVCLGISILDEEVSELLVKLLIVYDKEAVDVLFELVYSVNCSSKRLCALILERKGHDCDGKYSSLLRHFGNDGSRSGTGSSTQSGGDEEHIKLASEDNSGDFVLRVEGGIPSGGGIGAGSESVSQLYFGRDRAFVKGLGVGVADYEIAALHILPEHIVDGIATASTYAYDGYFRFLNHPV